MPAVVLLYWVAHTCGSGGILGMTGGKDLDWEKQRCAAPLKGGLWRAHADCCGKQNSCKTFLSAGREKEGERQMGRGCRERESGSNSGKINTARLRVWQWCASAAAAAAAACWQCLFKKLRGCNVWLPHLATRCWPFAAVCRAPPGFFSFFFLMPALSSDTVERSLLPPPWPC